MRIILTAFIFFSILSGVHGQETKFPKLQYKGYVKSLLSLTNPDNLDLLQTNHLFHQRNELGVFFSRELSLHIHNRNLIYTGQLLLLGNITENLENSMNDYADLALSPLDRGGIKMVNALDRFFLEWAPKDWEIKLGRQRINWGIHSFWNPNDIFNAYSFADFDYEERPGADALLVKHYFNWSTYLQFAYSPDDTWSEATFGALFGHNINNYDIQWLAAYDKEYFSAGVGTAGNIGEQSLKLEGTYFHPDKEDLDTELGIAVSLEGALKSGWIYGFSYLYDSKTEDQVSLIALNTGNLSARELYPYEHSFLLSFSRSLGARWSANWISAISIDEEIPLFLLPTMTYSIAQDWDLAVVGQIFFRKADRYESPLQVVNLRIRHSY